MTLDALLDHSRAVHRVELAEGLALVVRHPGADREVLQHLVPEREPGAATDTAADEEDEPTARGVIGEPHRFALATFVELVPRLEVRGATALGLRRGERRFFARHEGDV